MNAPTTYRGTITREQWLADETRVVARLRTDEGLTDADEIAARVLTYDLFQYQTEREVASIARACARRLEAVSNTPEIRNRICALIAHGTAEQLKQANFYALMHDNRIVWDFMLCVVAPKFTALDSTLKRHEIENFIEGLRTQDERAAAWSAETANKIRQVLTQCLEKCSMYDRKTEVLAPLLLDYDLENIIRANDDAQVLPAFGLML